MSEHHVPTDQLLKHISALPITDKDPLLTESQVLFVEQYLEDVKSKLPRQIARHRDTTYREARKTLDYDIVSNRFIVSPNELRAFIARAVLAGAMQVAQDVGKKLYEAQILEESVLGIRDSELE